jgi:hypothetical protein
MNTKNIVSNIPKYKLKDLLKNFARLANDPYVDWILIVVIWFILFIVVSGVGYWTFERISIQLSSATTAKSQITTAVFDEQRLNNVLNEFNNRRKEWIQLKDGSFPFPADPLGP